MPSTTASSTPTTPNAAVQPPAVRSHLEHILAHTIEVIPLPDLLGVLLRVLGEETLIEPDPAPAYALVYLDSPCPRLPVPSSSLTVLPSSSQTA